MKNNNEDICNIDHSINIKKIEEEYTNWKEKIDFGDPTMFADAMAIGPEIAKAKTSLDRACQVQKELPNYEFSRKTIDDPYNRNISNDSIKQTTFGDKKTAIDQYTDQKVFKNKTTAGGRTHSTEKTANVDHIVPIEKIKEMANGKLTPEQLKKIANSDYNLALTNEALNKSKGKMTNKEYVKAHPELSDKTKKICLNLVR